MDENKQARHDCMDRCDFRDRSVVTCVESCTETYPETIVIPGYVWMGLLLIAVLLIGGGWAIWVSR